MNDSKTGNEWDMAWRLLAVALTVAVMAGTLALGAGFGWLGP